MTRKLINKRTNMIKRYLFLIVSICASANINAQLNEGLYDKDRGHEVSDGPAPVRDQYKMLWDLEDRLMKGRQRIDTSMPNVPVRQGGIQIEYGSPSKRRSSSNSDWIKGKTKHVSPSAVNARIAADRERRMEQARIKRRRKKEEDDRSEMRARMQHAMLTAPMYQAAAERDHWHATEGARILSEIKAKDLVRWPTRQETSGAELAAGIKPKSKKDEQKGSITFESEPVLRSKQNFGNQNGEVDMAGNGVMDEIQVGSWIYSFEEPDLLNGNSTKKKLKLKKPVILVRHDELPLDSMSLFLLPKYGLVAASSDSLVVLSDSKLRSISWMNGESYDYVVTCGNKLIGKRDGALYVIDEKKSTKLLKFSTDDFSIFSHDEHSVLVLSWNEGLTTIIKVDVDNKTYAEMLRLPYVIWAIASNGKDMFALVENSLYIINENGFPIKMYTHEMGLNDLAFSPYGLLVASNDQIIYVKSKNEIGVFYEQGAKRLWTDSQGVYALNNDGDLLYFKNK